MKLITMVASLLLLFSFFKGTPNQLAGIKQLEKQLGPEVLNKDAEWFETWKVTGKALENHLPVYYSQYDLPDGHRMCATSAAAMAAKYLRAIDDQEQYLSIRSLYGDTTNVMAQVRALKAVGIHAEFRTNANTRDIYEALEKQQVVLVGWYHYGNTLRGEPPMCSSSDCGHWSIIHGFNNRYTHEATWVMSDPAGKPLLDVGGHDRNQSGYRVEVPQKAFNYRWLIEGKNTGWAIFVSP